MSCTDGTCGTGGWGGPQPGDPDNNISLSARVVFAGVLLSWNYPAINPHAVAFTSVYRSLTSDFANAIHVDEAAGASYLDRTDVPVDTEYYYWIEVVSIHGTRGARIGPASAIARPIVDQTIESLTDRIDDSLLAQTLRTSIAGLTLTNQALYDEIQNRLAGNQALQDALAAVQGEIGEALTYILNETTARTDADGAIVEQVNILAAGLDDAQAAILELQTVSAGPDEATAEAIRVLNVRMADNEAALIEEVSTRVTTDEAIVEDYAALYGRVGVAEGAILNIENLDINANSALATSLETLRTDVDDAASAVQQLDTALTNGTHALASTVNTVEAAINGNMATGEVGLIAEVNEVTGVINSMWTAKVEVNGLIGGFGIQNTGQEVIAGFDVDTFFIGRTGPDAVKPFIVSGGVVYMDEARIRAASIDSLKIKGEAVTVPVVASMQWEPAKRGQGEGVRIKVNSAVINMDQPGLAYILITAGQGFVKNDRFWSFEIEIQNSEFSNVARSVMGRQAESAPVASVCFALPAGPTRVNVLWQAHSDVLLGYSEIFMMGVKK